MNQLYINEKSYTGPSHWDELTPKQYFRLFKLSRIAVTASIAKFLALKIVYDIPNKVANLFFKNPNRIPEESDFLSPSDRAILLGIQLMDTVTWIWDKIPLRKWYYPEVRVWGKKFIGPGDSFRDLTFGQYMFTERFFEGARKEDRRYAENIRLFLGTLYRPANMKKFDRDKIDANARWLKWINPKKQEAIMFNYAGLRYQLTKDFPDIFPATSDEANQAQISKNASGWFDVALSITKTDLEMLYTYENADLFLVMKVLSNVIKENKELEAQRKA